MSFKQHVYTAASSSYSIASVHGLAFTTFTLYSHTHGALVSGTLAHSLALEEATACTLLEVGALLLGVHLLAHGP